MAAPLRYGLIGCGGFGRFCLSHYGSMENVICVAVTDAHEEMARTVAAEHQIDACRTPDELLARPDIDLVHIATPPFTHHRLALAALRAGKHVLCEKPLALEVEHADEMIRTARDRNLLLAVNLIMRYNPLCQAVKELIDSNALGRPIHASFCNAAQDEVLPPTHWFWDPAKSGGIFIEHGVHFFDLFEWWFGPGYLLSAEQIPRPDTALVDQVNCSVLYDGNILGTFYHGFHQMLRRDRQHWRIIFETGTLTMEEWVPTSMHLDMTVSETGLELVRNCFPAGEVRVVQRYSGTARSSLSRQQPRQSELHATLDANAGIPKMDLYGQLLRGLLNDQISFVTNPSHHRRIDEFNGLTSLITARNAQSMADSAMIR